ncbi:hypothetical protein AX16_010170 [Volvariella volvacea WC 439]|nr:hypothetical protein AX16_010170 [Volvariella volvacea WC 439]
MTSKSSSFGDNAYPYRPLSSQSTSQSVAPSWSDTREEGLPLHVAGFGQDVPSGYTKSQDKQGIENWFESPRVWFLTGFIFFPCWIIGVVEWWFPPKDQTRPTPDLFDLVKMGLVSLPRGLEDAPPSIINKVLLPELTPAEREAFGEWREQEKRLRVVWGRRCLWALLVYIVLVTAGFCTLWHLGGAAEA